MYDSGTYAPPATAKRRQRTAMPDPAQRAARALAACIRAYRDLLNDDGYAAVLPHLQALADALSDTVRVPAPRRREPEPHPMDREAR